MRFLNALHLTPLMQLQHTHTQCVAFMLVFCLYLCVCVCYTVLRFYAICRFASLQVVTHALVRFFFFFFFFDIASKWGMDFALLLVAGATLCCISFVFIWIGWHSVDITHTTTHHQLHAMHMHNAMQLSIYMIECESVLYDMC